jgi:hypothetical protein
MAERLMPHKLPVGRNTFLLSAGMAALYGMVQLWAAVTPITFEAVTGLEGLVGLGPAIFMSTAALALSPRDGRWTAPGGFPCSRGASLLASWGVCLLASGLLCSPRWRWFLGLSSSGLRKAR